MMTSRSRHAVELIVRVEALQANIQFFQAGQEALQHFDQHVIDLVIDESYGNALVFPDVILSRKDCLKRKPISSIKRVILAQNINNCELS